MEQFIAMAAEKLGVDAGMVEKALSAVLGLVKDQASGGDFDDLLGKLPGAGALLENAGSSGGGGLLGSVGGALGGVFGRGGDAGGALAALSQLKDSGLETDQIGSLVEMFQGYAGEQAGGDLVGKLMGNLPDLMNG